MSSIVSRSPSSMNHWKEAFWMSIRLGRSSTCFRREKLLRVRGAATRVVKSGCLPYGYEGEWEMRTGESRRGTAKYTQRGRGGARASGWVAARRSRTIDAGSAGRQARGEEGPRLRPLRLLELDLGAGLFQLRLDLVGLFLGRALLDRVGSAVDQVLGLLQAQAGDRANDLDHLDLLVAGVGEHDVEGGLLLRRRCAVAARRGRARGRHRNGSGGGDAPRLLELVLELDELKNACLAPLLDFFVDVDCCHYDSSPSVASSSAASGSASSASAASAGSAVASAVSPWASSWSMRACSTPTRAGKVILPSAPRLGFCLAAASFLRRGFATQVRLLPPVLLPVLPRCPSSSPDRRGSRAPSCSSV